MDVVSYYQTNDSLKKDRRVGRKNKFGFLKVNSYFYKANMEKLFLLSAIDKYYLNGIVEKTKWSVKENTLSINFIVPNKDMFGEIFTDDFESLSGSEIAIFDTSQLYKLVNVTDNSIQLSLNTKNKISTKLLITDPNYKLEYTLSDMLLIPKIPKVEEPEYECEFDITKELIDKYVKAKKAISDSDVVTIFTTFDDTGKGIVAFVIGEVDEFSNKINFSTPTTLMGIPSNKLVFSSNYLKEIFNSNKDMIIGKGLISSEGLMKFKFTTGKILSTYYLISKE